MESRDVLTGIGRSWRLIVDLELAETISNAGPLEVSQEFRDLLLRSDTTYAAIYRAGLRLSHYNFLLNDLSYFQFSWSKPDELRYAYYPNPFSVGGGGSNIETFEKLRSALVFEQTNSEDYLTELSEAKPEIRAPLIRYENAPLAYKELSHPCSHFHIGYHAENRWAINRVLSPLVFTLLILKHYYRANWDKHWKLEKDTMKNELELKLIEEKTKCKPVRAEEFSNLETRSFHFA